MRMKKRVDSKPDARYFTCMAHKRTLKDILAPYGVRSANDLGRVTGMSRQQAAEIFEEKCGIGKRVAKRIAEATGCSAAELLLYR